MPEFARIHRDGNRDIGEFGDFIATWNRAMNAASALERLKKGNQRFVWDLTDGNRRYRSDRRGLVSGQEPFAVILGCSDSRVPPEIAFDSGLGELFVVRVAGNVANKSGIAQRRIRGVQSGYQARACVGTHGVRGSYRSGKRS